MATHQTLIGSSAVTQLLEHLERWPLLMPPVLVRGATGVGKELVAREIHRLSGREASGDFIAVNCSAIPNGFWKASCLSHGKALFRVPSAVIKEECG